MLFIELFMIDHPLESDNIHTETSLVLRAVADIRSEHSP